MEKKASNGFSVYKHVSPNGKIYIGITSQPVNRRWRNGEGYRQNEHFSNAIRKYGWQNIEHEILYTGLGKAEAEQKEIGLIALYKSDNPQFGYNIEAGGNHHFVSEITKEKIRQKNLGKKQSPETVRKRVEKIRNPSEETRKKLSIASTGRKKSEAEIEYLRKINIGNRNAAGCKRSERHKQILRELKSKEVLQMTAEGVCVRKFSSLADAEKNTGISKGNICECVHGARSHAGGYVWKYVS